WKEGHGEPRKGGRRRRDRGAVPRFRRRRHHRVSRAQRGGAQGAPPVAGFRDDLRRGEEHAHGDRRPRGRHRRVRRHAQRADRHRLHQGRAVEPAKALRDFAKTHESLVVKSGYFEGKLLSKEDVQKLADLESREVLLAKAAGAMKASMSKAAATFAAPLSKAARTMDALREKQEAA